MPCPRLRNNNGIQAWIDLQSILVVLAKIMIELIFNLIYVHVDFRKYLICFPFYSQTAPLEASNL